MEPSARAAWQAARPASPPPIDAACLAPWVSLELDPSGWVYGCCANQLYPLGRLDRERLPDIWHGDRAAVLRSALSRWDMSVGCGTCRWHLEHGRMDPDAAVYDRYELAGPEPAGPRSMTFALSNRCNLGCVMCTPELSSTLRQRAGLPPIASPYDDRFFEDLAAFLPGLSYAKFLGGEPLLIPEHHRVWDLMDEVGPPPRIQITTNGTVWSDRVEWLLDRFSVDVTISIDAASSAAYEAIRVGARHADVMANVDRYLDRCRAAGTELRFCFCLMDRNWEELSPFLRWADELEVPVSINVVTDVGLALHDLPTGELEEVWQAWTVDDRGPGRPTGTNADVWSTQLDQLDAVLAERRRGIVPPPRQAQRVPSGFLARRPPDVAEADPEAEPRGSDPAELQRDRLAAWCGGGEVGVVDVDDAGVVSAVPAPHRRLGLDAALVGRPLDELVSAIEAEDGRPAWLLGEDVETEVLVRTVVLAAERPVRGVSGSIVRLVALPRPEGQRLLVAEDRIYDGRPTTVSAPVEVPRRRSLPLPPEGARDRG